MSVYGKNHYNIVISLQLIKINDKKIEEWNNTVCNNMDEPRDCHTETTKSDREGNFL